MLSRPSPWGAATRCALVLVLLPFGESGAQQRSDTASGKIPITTASAEARELYIRARDLSEGLRTTDARALFQQAIAKDPDFALAHVGLASTSSTPKEFFDAAARAAALGDRLSEGERHLVLALAAAAKGDVAGQERHLVELVRLFPNDERAHNALGTVYFVRQDFPKAIEHENRALAIARSYPPSYNQLGYAYSALEKYDEAEKAFKRYIELVPGDPNPYDSYAELLMKMGRFEESIASYQKALGADPNFVLSYIGTGNNHLFMGQGDKARAAFAKLGEHARNTGERRLAHFWTAASYVYEGATDKAVAAMERGYALAEAEGDRASMFVDLLQIGDILQEAGRTDEALARLAKAVSMNDSAQVPETAKQFGRRNHLFHEGRVLLAKGDIAAAKGKLSELTKQVAIGQNPFELRQQHELAGAIALAEKRYQPAVDELRQASQQDPRVMYLTALALQGAGDRAGARTLAAKAARFNGSNINYGFVRTKAQKIAGS